MLTFFLISKKIFLRPQQYHLEIAKRNCCKWHSNVFLLFMFFYYYMYFSEKIIRHFMCVSGLLGKQLPNKKNK